MADDDVRAFVRVGDHVLEEAPLQLVANTVGRSGARCKFGIEEVVMNVAQQHLHQRPLDEVGQRDALDRRSGDHAKLDLGRVRRPG